MHLKCKKNRNVELRHQIGGPGADLFVFALGKTPGRDGLMLMCSTPMPWSPKRIAKRALRIGMIVLAIWLGPALLHFQQDR